MADLKGRVVLIFGAGRGAGRTLAEVFAGLGAAVAVNDISPVNLDELAQGSDGRIRAYPEDVAKKVGVQSVINRVEDDFGRVDVLVNHSAVEPHDPFLEMDEWDWHRVLDVNLTGAFLTMQSVGRVMRPQGGGVMFNLIGMRGSRTGPEAAYAASMYGLIALTQAAALELAPYGIFVHAVGHGISQFHNADPEVPKDLVGAVLHLYESSLNGQIVNVEAA